METQRLESNLHKSSDINISTVCRGQFMGTKNYVIFKTCSVAVHSVSSVCCGGNNDLPLLSVS